jgi:hypothetical protein
MPIANSARASEERTVQSILAVAGLFVLAHACIPFDEFIHRTDDTFYYLQAAYNHPVTGFWSFDSIHPTNGVQPLWAWLLTAVAHVMTWVGLRDPDLFARTVVAITGLFHIASSLLLFRLLARQVSVAVGAAAAAAFLLPMGIVWQLGWGMENSLHAFFIVATLSYYQLVFRAKESNGRAIVLGLLFGLTALSRLNAVLLAICAVGTLLLTGRRLAIAQRIRYAAIVALVSAACVVPYLLSNYLSTGHPLPISGAVKAVYTDQFMEANGLSSRFSPSYITFVLTTYHASLRTFLSTRIADGTALAGGRILVDDQQWTKGFAIFLLVLFAVARVVGGKTWLGELRATLGRLRPFWFVLAYAVINAAVCMLAYPQQIRNAMIKWWLVESELIVVVLTSVLVGTALATVGTRLVVPAMRRRVAAIGLILLVALHGQQMVRFYWDGKFQIRDWNASWNDEEVAAARWLRANVPREAIVGSWNAGALGYYASQRVTNLDGLINNFELLPYLRDRNVGGYITKNNIAYLSDMESIFTTYKIHEQLTLREIYSRHNGMMDQDYKIYRVER